MTNIFEEIRTAVDGVVGSYIMNMEGKIIASDVPPLFENELVNASGDMFQLIDIVKSERPIDSIEVKADQGYIQLAVSDNYILGTFASKHADGSLLDLVVNKAINKITPDILEALNPKASEPPAALNQSTDITARVSASVPGESDIDDEVRITLCQHVKGKLRIMYGDKMAEKKVSEAFDQVGAKRDTRNSLELKAAFDVLADGILSKMMGKKKAKKFLEELYKETGLE